MESNGAVVKEMEAERIAWVFRIMATQVLATEAITDLIDVETPTEE